jgi:hypothetical protein
MKNLYIILIAILTLNIAKAQQGVSINITGNHADSSAMLDVSSITKGILIPRMTEAQKLQIVNPKMGLLIYQTDNIIGFWYYNTSIPAWVQAIGPVGPTGVSGATGVTGVTGSQGIHGITGATGASGTGGGICSHTIGESYGGGIIFYLSDASTCHGLIAPTGDQSTSSAWSSEISNYSGAFLDNGFTNTDAIIAQGDTLGAGYLCYNLSLNTYTDWYLPSKEELAMMYVRRVIIGNFTTGEYWSSWEYSTTGAMAQWFNNGWQLSGNKSANRYVRCIRAF